MNKIENSPVNLNQLRAFNAYNAAHDEKFNFSGKNGGEVAKKVPVRIRENGIMAELVFALESKGNGKRKNEGDYNVFMAIIAHLKSCGILNHEIANTDDLFEFMRKTEDQQLFRSIVSETLEYLNYFRRLVEKASEEE